MNKRCLPVDRGAVKALVALFGPREAARQAGLNENTVLGWCYRFRWKKAVVSPRRDAGDMITEALQRSKELSTVHLAKYTERAAVQAAEHKDPLEVARKVRDVASVYGTLWPAEEKTELIEGDILIGAAEVKDASPEGIKDASAVDVIEDGDDTLREALPDQRPAGD